MLHGGDVLSYRDLFAGELTDFSSNINPLGFPPELKQALAENSAALCAYPDRYYRKLKQAVAEYLHCVPQEVIVGNGAMEIIDAFICDFDSVVVCPPCFSEYEIRAAVHKKNITFVPQLYQTRFLLDEQNIKNALQEKSLLVLTNPNNPTGRTIGAEQLERIYQAVIEKNAFLLLDETFVEFTELGYDSISLFKKHGYKNLAIIRAATKFFGLPGLRLAYACAAEKTAEEVSSKMLSWHVNAAAEIAGSVIFRDSDYIAKTKALIKAERAFLQTALAQCPAVQVVKSDANFILLRLRISTAERAFYFFVRRGIILRKANSFFSAFEKSHTPELARAEWIRIAVKNHADNEKLISVFQQWCSELGLYFGR